MKILNCRQGLISGGYESTKIRIGSSEIVMGKIGFRRTYVIALKLIGDVE